MSLIQKWWLIVVVVLSCLALLAFICIWTWNPQPSHDRDNERWREALKSSSVGPEFVFDRGSEEGRR